jgi:hypothetical protein
LSGITVANNTGGEVLPTTNYSFDVGKIQPQGINYNNTVVRVMASYTYPSPNTENVVQNITGGVTTFFSNTGTIFSILVVVVIILAITIIIYAVSRFGGGGSPNV